MRGCRETTHAVALELDHRMLVALAALIEGCGYYGCKDDLKQDFVPEQGPGSLWQEGYGQWLDAQTLEVNFGGPLRPADEVDPRRFALLRYGVALDSSTYSYYCSFDVCEREIDGFESIPESLSWDAAKPGVVQLHFTEPVPASACKPWTSNRGNYQALELIYLGVESWPYGETGEQEPFAEPDQLAYEEGDRPIDALGAQGVRGWLEGCFAQGSCGSLGEICSERSSEWSRSAPSDIWVECP